MPTKGRGLAELFAENYVDIDQVNDGELVVDIKLSEIKPNPYQPRKIFNQEKIDELAQSIKEHGVFQPIILKKATSGYIIVSGERRYRASKQLNLETIPAIVREYNQAKVAQIALIENLQREDLNPLEEAEAYKTIMKELNITQQELADKIGKSRSYVTNTIGLLVLPKTVQAQVLGGLISMGHARALSKLKDSKRIKMIAEQIVQKGLSVRQVEELTKDEVKARVVAKKPTVSYLEYEKALNKKGLNVKITQGKVVIKSNGDVMDIVKLLLGDKDV